MADHISEIETLRREAPFPWRYDEMGPEVLDAADRLVGHLPKLRGGRIEFDLIGIGLMAFTPGGAKDVDARIAALRALFAVAPLPWKDDCGIVRDRDGEVVLNSYSTRGDKDDEMVVTGGIVLVANVFHTVGYGRDVVM